MARHIFETIKYSIIKFVTINKPTMFKSTSHIPHIKCCRLQIIAVDLDVSCNVITFNSKTVIIFRLGQLFIIWLLSCLVAAFL
jgi:hypothetical protein